MNKVKLISAMVTVCLLLSSLGCMDKGAAQAGHRTAPSQTTVKYLRCEYRIDPLGIDVTKPRLSWLLDSRRRSQRQSAYQILVAGSEQNLKRDVGDLWDTGRISSDQSGSL